MTTPDPPRPDRVDPARIVVVGAGLAAARTCEQLRRRGHSGSITLVGAEEHLPYDRPPLSKEVLRGTRDDTTLAVDLTALDVTVRLGVRATGVRLDERVVTSSAGDIGWDGLVVATGATPVRLPGDGEQLTLRTVDDSHRLRERLVPGARVVVVGASWIGAEVATAAVAHGCRVTCVEAGPAPAAQALGAEVGARLLPWWEEVDLRLETGVTRIDDGGVVLGDGSTLVADTVLTGVGVRPATGWLADSGLELDRGVVVDERLAAAAGVVAVGDVAARWSPRWGRRLRVEHWDDASSGPAVAAATLLGQDDAVHDPVPYFWSDQFGHKLQYVGHHTDRDAVRWREPGDRPGWSAEWLDDGGQVTAVLAVDRPREIAQARRSIAGPASPSGSA